VGDGLRNGAGGREWVEGSEGASKLERREWVVVTGCWIRFRNYLRRKEIGEDITLLMDGLVLALDIAKDEVSNDFVKAKHAASHYKIIL
jgi:hypothetical protein